MDRGTTLVPACPAGALCVNAAIRLLLLGFEGALRSVDIASSYGDSSRHRSLGCVGRRGSPSSVYPII